jgi:hypothetical protein
MKIIFLALNLAIIFPAYAGIAIAGSGNLTCEKYLEIRAQGVTGGIEPAMLIVIWMQGYLSGANAERIRNGRDNEVFNIPSSSQGIKQMMDKACAGRSTMHLMNLGIGLSEGIIKVKP